MTNSMTDNAFKYWAFLSCSPEDNREQRPGAPGADGLCWGNWLHDVLKSFSIPAEFAGQVNARGEIIPQQIEPVFQFQNEPGEDAGAPGVAYLSARAREALEQSRYLIVICSPRSARNLQVNEAVRHFKQLGRGSRILPLVIAGEPNASDSNRPGISLEDECLVPAMRHPVMPDGALDMSRQERRPIFADARHGADKREILAKDQRSAETELEIAKIQLIAGLIGVGFNGLLRHEQKRRFAGFAEAQHQVRETRNELLEARNQAREAEGKVQEAQTLAREAQHQLEEAREQARSAQKRVLEIQNLPRDVQSQLEEAWSQARAAQSQVQEIERKAREAQSQLEEARNEAREAKQKVLEAQDQAQDKVQEFRNQTQDAQSRIQEAHSQALEAQNQARESRNQAQEIEGKAREVQSQLEEARNEAREAKRQVQEAQDEAQAAQSRVQEIQTQTRDVQGQIQEAQRKVLEAQNQAREAEHRVQTIENKARDARRHTKVLALVTVLALLAAGIAASIALWQRKVADLALAKVAAGEAGAYDPASAPGTMGPEQIRQLLQKMGGADQDGNRRRSLDELAAQIPTNSIAEVLKASSSIADDRLRSHFQRQALLRWSAVAPQPAMAWASAAEGKILNEEGQSDSRLYFQLAVLDNWVRTNLTGALEWARQLPEADARQRALETVIAARAANDPQGTLVLLNDLKPAPGGPVYTALFERWAAQDAVKAIEQRQQVPDHDADARILCAIMAVWMEQQPEAALTWVKSQPDSESKNKALETCVQSQAKTDFSKALALADSLPARTWRNTVVAGLFDGWAAKDLAAATTACQQLPDGAAKDKAREILLSRRMANDPASAAEEVKNQEAGDYRQSAIAALCEHWAETNAPAALAWAQSLPSEAERAAAVSRVVARWARTDASGAMQFAAEHDGELSGAALGEIAAARAKDDVPGAVAWARSLKADTARQAALGALLDCWAQKDAGGLAAYALGLPAGEAQTQALTAACRQLAPCDLPKVVELLKPISDDATRRNLFELAGRSCDLAHMDQAAQGIAAMPAGDDQKAAIKGLLATWAAADPEAAVNWLRAYPEGNAQTEQVQAVLKRWSQSEPAAAAKWLTNLPAGPNSEALTGIFFESAVEKHPEFAGPWTQTVTDEATRQKFRMEVARRWLKADPNAALKWINGLELPEDVKQTLRTAAP